MEILEEFYNCIYPCDAFIQVVLGDIGVPVESPTREELKHVPDIEDQEISKADTSGIYVIVVLLLHLERKFRLIKRQTTFLNSIFDVYSGNLPFQ